MGIYGIQIGELFYVEAAVGVGALLQAEEAAEGGGLDDHVNDRGGGAWGLLCGCGPCGRGSSVVQSGADSNDVDSGDAATAPSRSGPRNPGQSSAAVTSGARTRSKQPSVNKTSILDIFMRRSFRFRIR